MNIKDYKLRFILINKTNVKDILEVKYPCKDPSKILFINVHI
jgi:hypothetical protein